jgi:hypothetical protein
MNKISLIVLIFAVFLSFNVSANEIEILDIRNNIFKECREIQLLLGISKDIIVVNSMWSSGILTICQLDAYFSMVGIFNSVKDRYFSEDPVDYLIRWLDEIKNTNELNIRSLDSISYEVEPSTKEHITRLRSYYNTLNNIIAAESARVSELQKVLRINQ